MQEVTKVLGDWCPIRKVDGFDESKSRAAVKSLNILLVGGGGVGKSDLVSAWTNGEKQLDVGYQPTGSTRYLIHYFKTTKGVIEIIFSDTNGQEAGMINYRPVVNPFAHCGDSTKAVDGVMLIFDHGSATTHENLKSVFKYMERFLPKKNATVLTAKENEMAAGAKQVPVVLLGNNEDGGRAIKPKHIKLPAKAGIPYWSCSCINMTASTGGHKGDLMVVPAAFFDPFLFILQKATGEKDLALLAP